MQEQSTFSLSNEFILEKNPDLPTLKKELQGNLKAIEALLVSYHFKSRSRVFGVSINESSIEFINSVMAKMLVHYSVGQFNACADVDFSDKATMEILIDLDID